MPVATRAPSWAGDWRRPTNSRGRVPLWSLGRLRTPFRPHGRVTAGNAAGLNDGATACLLAAEPVAEELGLPVAMRLVSFAFAGVDPEVMGVGPIPATEKALAKADLSIDDIGAFEINEAFAVQVLAFSTISDSTQMIRGSIRMAARSRWAIRSPARVCA